MPARIERLGLPAILCAFLVLAIGYSVVVPLGEAPDEVSHWAYVQYLVEHHSLPTPQGAVLGESHQPPLYYLLGALTTFWIPQPAFEPIANPDFAFENAETPNLLLHTRREEFPYQGVPLAWHLLRLLSVVMGAVTVWTTWRIAREFLPDEPQIALGAAAFVAFLPAFTFLSAVVNNDNLIVILSSLSVWQAVTLARRPWSARRAALLGVLLGLDALTKLSGLVVWLFAAAVFALIAWRTRRWRQTAIYGATAFGVALAVAAPLAIYNWVHYGDPLAWSLVMAATPVRSSPITPDDWRVVLWGLFTSFWGRFGGALHLRMADALYAVLGVVGALAAGGWVRWARARGRAALPSGMPAVLAAFGAFWFLMLAAFVRWTRAVLGTDQA
ncbi:MAG: glycosyltransferase family 39 protein, partial [Chloroflexi bacterium]|nr:glycosyltransferase family 39 protein [Chloroflexota bacterium]